MKERLSVTLSDNIVRKLKESRKESGVPVSVQIELLLRKHQNELQKAVVLE